MRPDPESIENATRALRYVRVMSRPTRQRTPIERATRQIMSNHIEEQLHQLPDDVLQALADATLKILDEPDRYRLEWVDGMPLAVDVNLAGSR